jgi:hypothetical protein
LCALFVSSLAEGWKKKNRSCRLYIGKSICGQVGGEEMNTVAASSRQYYPGDTSPAGQPRLYSSVVNLRVQPWRESGSLTHVSCSEASLEAADNSLYYIAANRSLIAPATRWACLYSIRQANGGVICYFAFPDMFYTLGLSKN